MALPIRLFRAKPTGIGKQWKSLVAQRFGYMVHSRTIENCPGKWSAQPLKIFAHLPLGLMFSTKIFVPFDKKMAPYFGDPFIIFILGLSFFCEKKQCKIIEFSIKKLPFLQKKVSRRGWSFHKAHLGFCLVEGRGGGNASNPKCPLTTISSIKPDEFDLSWNESEEYGWLIK